MQEPLRVGEGFAAAAAGDREGVVAEGVPHALDALAVHAVGSGDDGGVVVDVVRQDREDDDGVEVAGVVGDDQERALDFGEFSSPSTVNGRQNLRTWLMTVHRRARGGRRGPIS